MAGFSAAEAAHAICCEELPGSKSIEEFNRRLCEGSGLPPVEQDSIAYGSLACGHTNMALRAIAASVPSDCPLLSHAGHMSLEQLRTRDTTYATAVEQGLKWTVLKHAVRRDYPRALDIIQAQTRAGVWVDVLLYSTGQYSRPAELSPAKSQYQIVAPGRM
jgi:hypothetical protein